MSRPSVLTQTSAIARSAVATFILIGAAASAALLLYLSFRFEAVAYAQILGPLGAQPLFADSALTVAEGLAAGLNSIKIALIYVTARLLIRPRGWRALFPRAMHAFLITVSLVMTLLVIGGQTISPDAERRLASLQEATEARFATQQDRLEAGAATRREEIRQSFDTERAQLTRSHRARIAELQAGIDAERENVVNGEFYGPKYQDYERNIELQRAVHASRSDELRVREQAAIAEVNDALAADRAALRQDRETALSGVSLGSVFDVEEAQNPYLLRFLEIARFMAPDDVEIEIVALTVFVAVMLSLGLEVSPIVVLGYVFRSLSRPDASSEEASLQTPAVPEFGEPANENGPHSRTTPRAARSG